MEAGKFTWRLQGGLCFTCHQPTGLGMRTILLTGSDWVLGDKTRLIKISIHGLMGEIESNGVKYNNVMHTPPGNSTRFTYR